MRIRNLHEVKLLLRFRIQFSPMLMVFLLQRAWLGILAVEVELKLIPAEATPEKDDYYFYLIM